MGRILNEFERKQQILKEAMFIASTGATLRKAEEALGVPKTTIHKHMVEELCAIDFDLYNQVIKVIAYNKATRSVRGGLARATKCKKK